MNNTRSYKTLFGLLAIMLFSIIILFAYTKQSYASEEVASGTCGDNLTWTLDSEGVLTISGSGAMDDYETASSSPWYSNRQSIVKVVIEDGVTHIGDRSFYNCSNLKEVKIGDAVESIGIWALYNNSSLETLTVPENVRTIEDSGIRSCASLKTVYFMGEPPSAGNYVLEDCPSAIITIHPGSSGWDVDPWISYKIEKKHLLSNISVIIEPTCTEHGSGQGVCQICGETVGEELPALGHDYIDGVCSRCGDLQIIASGKYWVLYGSGLLELSSMEKYSHGSAPWYEYRNLIRAVEIESGVFSVGQYAFIDCINLTNITIPDSVTSIETYAFYGCSSLTNVTIPDSVTSIGSDAFAYCSSLTNVTIPDSVTSIGSDAFAYCSSLTNVTIPDSVTSIGERTFQNCSSLTNVTIPNYVTSIGERTFQNCSSLTNVTIPDSVTSIGSDAFAYCSSLTNVTIPDSVTSIGERTFQNCSSLTNVTIPESVMSIGIYAFHGCSNLTNVTIPDSVTSIGLAAFASCSSLTNVTIPESVISIGNYAFCNCSSLTNVTIPDSVTSIGLAAFASCSSLTNVTIPESVTSIGSNAFSGCNSILVLYVVEDSYAHLYALDNGCKYDLTTGHQLDSGIVTKKPTCTVFGERTYTCTTCGRVIKTEIIPATGHIWSDPVYIWTDDNSYVTAEMICKNDADHSHVVTESVKTTSEVTKAATTTEKGETTYTAIFSNKSFYTQTRTVANIENETASYSSNSYRVVSVDKKTAAFTKAKNAKSVVVPASITINGETYKVTQIDANAFKGSKIRTVTIGKNVKAIKKNAFKGSPAAKLILKTNLLKKAKVKGCLKGSKIKTVQVKVGNKATNKKFVKSYKKIFTKANVGSKVTVK